MSEPQNKTVEAEESRPLITKLHIQNYKSLVDVELELGRFNVLIGENGCGKSNILEALTLGSLGSRNSFVDYEMLFNRLRVGELQDLKSKFLSENLEMPIGIEYDIDKQNHQEYFFRLAVDENDKHYLHTLGEVDDKMLAAFINLTKELSTVIKSSIKIKQSPSSGEEQKDILVELKDILDKVENIQINKRIHSDRVIERNSAVDIDKVKKRLNKRRFISEYLHYQPSESVLREVNSESGQIPLGERGERLFDAYERLDEVRLARLKESLQLINWFDDMEVNYRHGIKREIKLKDKYFDELTPLLDFRHVNEGFLFILFYMVLFLHPQSPPFFGIDNLDTALNPKLAAKLTSILTEMAKDYDKQVIVTTHNPMLLDGLDLDDDQVRLFVVYRNPDGHTNVRRFKPENKQVRLSEAWIRGYLGGLPMI